MNNVSLENQFGEVQLNSGERIDVLPSGARLFQDDGCFSYGIDAVLLAYFANVKKGGRCLDLGAGNGIVPVLMSSVFPRNEFHGLELQNKPYALSLRSVEINGLEERVYMHQGDVKNPWAVIEKNFFSTVTANPPYMLPETGNVCVANEKAIARHEICATLDDFCKTAFLALNSSGHFFMIHRANRLEDVMASLKKNKFTPKTLQFVFPDIESKATMVLIESVKGGKSSFCNVEPPLFVYDSLGNKSEAVQKIYRRFSESGSL